MSAFDTNPFADPVDVNPFQVEPPNSQISPGPRAAAWASFARAGRRGVGGTDHLSNGRAVSEGWPIKVCMEAGLCNRWNCGKGAGRCKEVGSYSTPGCGPSDRPLLEKRAKHALVLERCLRVRKGSKM